MTTIHFPPVSAIEPRESAPMVNNGSAPKQKRTAKPDPERQPNVMQAFTDALRDAELIREKLRNLVNSGSRHGDLQVTLSALRRAEDSVRLLIEAEERSS